MGERSPDPLPPGSAELSQEMAMFAPLFTPARVRSSTAGGRNPHSKESP